MDAAGIKPIVSAIKILCNLYQKATIEDKRCLVETIFNEMLIYDKDGYRTINLNTIAAITYLKNKELQRQKKGKNLNFKTFPQLWVECPPFVDGFYVRFNTSG